MSFLDQFRRPPPAVNGRVVAGTDFWTPFRGGGQGYALAALEKEVDELAQARQPGRNHALNQAAFSLGQLVAGGALTETVVVDALRGACITNGLARDDGTLAVDKTIQSGLNAGGLKPRGVPERSDVVLYVPFGTQLPSPVDEPVESPAAAVIEAAPDVEAEGEAYWSARTVDGGSFVFDTPDLPPAVWGDGQEVLWAQGEALMVCGPSGVGKTTVAVQLVEARLGIGDGTLFGLPVQRGSGRVLYLAMDRPPQVARAMGRVFREEDRQQIAERLLVWKGPPPYDLAKRPETLVMMCRQAGADTLIVDSLKDGVLKLSDDESGGGYNKSRQMALVEGIEVIELHHQRKSGGDNKKPTKLDDVYGSTWITAGAGSVIVLWGEPGDPVVELIHLKQPAEPLGPWMVKHDHARGRSGLHHAYDVIELVRNQRAVGMTAQLLAKLMFTTDKPKPAEVEKARRKLNSLTRDGFLVMRPGNGGQESATYHHVDSYPSIDSGERA